MRTDLTVRTATGGECDVAVFAPDGTPWDAVSDRVRAAVAGAEPRWCGSRALHAGMVVGQPPLVTGAVLTDRRPCTRPDSTVRLEVVGGRDCGAAVAIGAASLDIGRDPDCDLVLTDPLVSRRHARVRVGPAGVTAIDLASTDGIHLCGRRVATARLGPGTVLRVGSSFLALDGVAGSTPRPVAVPVPQAPAPPERAGRLPLAATLLPAVLGAGLALLTRSWEFLAFAALTPLAALASAFGERRHARRAYRSVLARYHRDRADSENARSDALRNEAVHRRREFPHPAALRRDRGVVRDGASPDLLRVRIGLGAMPSHLQDDREIVDVPVTIDLAAGPVAVVGPREVTRELARWLVVQIAMFTSPADVAVEVPMRGEWRWARWLPHASSATAAHVVEVRDSAAADDATTGARATAVVLVDEIAAIPAGCTTRIVVADDPGATVIAYPPGDERRTAVADRIDAGLAEQLARSLAGAGDGRPNASTIPRTCHLTDLIDHADPETRWRRSTGAADTTIGMGAGGPVRIDLDRDGPHVLVAGSTGAGKSELLQCLVAGLAVEHPPRDMSFLLVDYKGGAAFGECARLPHTVGLVTDLDAQLTRRVLTALDSELARRERLFAAAGAADLASYRATRRTPIARLVIVVDEFATLADELGDFVPSLVGIARRGRSLGLHLVLATQRPSGVVSPEIRANTALRICLRVTSAAESIDVVDTPAAADIAHTTPGRAILRVGADTRVFQTARVCGAAEQTASAVGVVALGAWRGVPEQHRGAAVTDLQRAVSRARAAHRGMPSPHRPWLEPLPSVLFLAESTAEPDAEPEAEPGIAIGRVDLPAEQRQPGLTLDFDAGATVLITGGPRSGRSSALRMIAHAAAAQHPPHELQLYGIDATGCGLAELRVHPHTGTVATTAEGFDFAARLVERLAATSRRSLLVVDGWDELLAASDECDGGRTAERLTNMLRAGLQGVLTSVVAGGRATLSPRLATLATARFVLRLNDAGEYAAAGVPAHCVPCAPPPGRAVRLSDWAPVQFAWLDRPVPVAGEAARDALRMRPLPRSITLSQLPSGNGTVLGVHGDTGEVAAVDLLASEARLLLAGPARSGRSTALRTILRQHRGCTVVAPARSPLAAAARAGDHAMAQLPGDLPDAGLLLVDDIELVADTELGDAIAAWADSGAPRRAVVAAGRTEALALGYRGVIAWLRAQSCGILLRPCPADGALLGVTVATTRTPWPAGRGVLVPDPRWGLGADPTQIQVAAP